MRDVWTPRLIPRAAPDAKILVIFRDPVEQYARACCTPSHGAAAVPPRTSRPTRSSEGATRFS